MVTNPPRFAALRIWTAVAIAALAGVFTFVFSFDVPNSIVALVLIVLAFFIWRRSFAALIIASAWFAILGVALAIQALWFGVVIYAVFLLGTSQALPVLWRSRKRPPAQLSPATGEPEIGWNALMSQLNQMADNALQNRSEKVKEMLASTDHNLDALERTIDRTSQTSIMFVDPARLTNLANEMRQLVRNQR